MKRYLGVVAAAALLAGVVTVASDALARGGGGGDADYVAPLDMLAELRDDNKQLTAKMRETHDLCEKHHDVATESLLENWIDEADRRTWFLFECTRRPA